jgi:hypothetical protein
MLITGYSVERLIFWRRLASRLYPDDLSLNEDDWSESTSEAFLCDYSAVIQGTDTVATCGTGHCLGHYPEDPIFFLTFPDIFDGPISNKQFLEWITPTSDSVPFMYDSFDWPVCTDGGYTFDYSSTLEKYGSQ